MNPIDGRLIGFHPICEIEYQDGAKMTTIVGIFCSDEDAKSKLNLCEFESLDFLPAAGEPIRIVIPKLTVREIKSLERQLPLGDIPLVHGNIPAEDARSFADFYRYLPSFAVLEV